ncbi:MAG: MBL fold metallo-hydrolase [Candidatus Heimdallarchaeota archaeon]
MSKDHNHHLWEHHVIGYVSTNCYVFGKQEEAVLVDPGGPEVTSIVKKLQEKEIEIKHVVVTHGHFDHLGWAADVMKLVEGAKVYLHEAEKPAVEPFLDRMVKQWGLPPCELREPDVWVREDNILDMAGLKYKVIHTPGHSPGSAVFQLLSKKEGHSTNLNLDSAFVGDLVFQGSIGRFDLPFSDGEDMKASLIKLMEILPKHSELFPGHGNITDMGTELESNPYLLAIKRNVPFF